MLRATGGANGGATARTQSVHAGDRRCGGRFWALAEEDDADGEADDPPSPPSPTPSDHVNDWFNAGYSEEEVASAIDDVLPIHDPARLGIDAGEKIEMVRRRTSLAAIKPWKGPLPKVLFRATALIRRRPGRVWLLDLSGGRW